LKMNFSVHVQDNTESSQQRCHILTIHDVGLNNKEFEAFVNGPEMKEITKRVIWVHVNLPGQEWRANELPIKKYPSLSEIADGMDCIFETLKMHRAVLFGDRCGANLCVEFANKHPGRVQGLVLIEPLVSTAGFFESMKYKYAKASPMNIDGSSSRKSSKTSETAELMQNDDNQSNVKNISMLAQSFISRAPLKDKIASLSVDVLIITGRDSAHFDESARFFQILRDSRKDAVQRLVNCPFLDIDTNKSVLERPERVATSLGYFLQGIGLLSAMPFKGVGGKNRLLSSNGRSMSMEEADRPRGSFSSQADSILSAASSSNRSISNSSD